MLLTHRGATPTVDPTAYVAPTAVVCGNVTIKAHARVLFGAVLTAEDGTITTMMRGQTEWFAAHREDEPA